MVSAASLALVQLNLNAEQIDISSIKPVSPTPVKRIPNYVFENCNQVTMNKYTDQGLESLRSSVKTVSLKRLRELISDEKKLTTKCEEYDWVYGLDYLEEAYLQKGVSISQLDVEAVVKINGLFSRFSNTNPGKFRESVIYWPKEKDGSTVRNATEHLMLQILENEIIQKRGAKGLIDLLHTDGKFPIKWSRLEKLKQQLMTKGMMRIPGEGLFVLKPDDLAQLDLTLFEKWKAEYSDKKTKPSIDACAWLRDHAHYFPHPTDIVSELEKTLSCLKDPLLHPIQKACRIWFDIVKIHISHEANKRTGKALGCIVLLENGFSPPIIAKAEHQEYIKVLHDALENPALYPQFEQFIAKRIIKQQSPSSESTTKSAADAAAV